MEATNSPTSYQNHGSSHWQGPVKLAKLAPVVKIIEGPTSNIYLSPRRCLDHPCPQNTDNPYMDSCAFSFDLVYEGVTHVIIICLVLKSEAAALKNIIRDLQP